MVLAFAHQKGLEIKADVSPADFGDSLSPADVAGLAGHATYMVSLQIQQLASLSREDLVAPISHYQAQ